MSRSAQGCVTALSPVVSVRGGGPFFLVELAEIAPQHSLDGPLTLKHVVVRGSAQHLARVRALIIPRRVCVVAPVRPAVLFQNTPGERRVLVVEEASRARVECVGGLESVSAHVLGMELRLARTLAPSQRTLCYAGTVTGVRDAAAGIYVLDDGRAWLCASLSLREPAAALTVGDALELSCVHATCHNDTLVFAQCMRGTARNASGGEVGVCDGNAHMVDCVSLPDYLWLWETCSAAVQRLAPLLTPACVWPTRASRDPAVPCTPRTPGKCLARHVAKLGGLSLLARSVYTEFLSHNGGGSRAGCSVGEASARRRRVVGVAELARALSSDAAAALHGATVLGVLRPTPSGAVELADSEERVPVRCVDADVAHFGHVWAMRSFAVAPDASCVCVSVARDLRKLAARAPLLTAGACRFVGRVVRRFIPSRERLTATTTFSLSLRCVYLHGDAEPRDVHLQAGQGAMWLFSCVREGGTYCFGGTFTSSPTLTDGSPQRLCAGEDCVVDDAALLSSARPVALAIDALAADLRSRPPAPLPGVTAVVEDPRLDAEGGDYRIDVVDFEGVVVATSDRQGDVVALGSTAPVVLCVRVRDHVLPHAIDVYVDTSRHVPPIGLWVGASVRVVGALRKVSRTGNIYCSLFARSSLEVATAGGGEAPVPSMAALPTRLIGSLVINDASQRLPRTTLFRVHATISLVLDISASCSCGRCGRTLRNDECSSGCVLEGGASGARRVFSVRARVGIEDGSGEATCYLFDDTAIAALGMASSRVAYLRRISARHGTLYYSHISVPREALVAEGLAAGEAAVSAGSDSLAAAEFVLIQCAHDAVMRRVVLYCRRHVQQSRDERAPGDPLFGVDVGAQSEPQDAPYPTRAITLGGIEFVTRVCEKVLLKAVAAEEDSPSHEAVRLLALLRTRGDGGGAASGT